MNLRILMKDAFITKFIYTKFEIQVPKHKPKQDLKHKDERFVCLPGVEKNQRRIAQTTRMRGMTWTAFSADLRRDLSFLAACERGLYVGSCRGTVSELCCFELCDWDGDDDDDDEELV